MSSFNPVSNLLNEEGVRTQHGFVQASNSVYGTSNTKPSPLAGPPSPFKTTSNVQSHPETIFNHSQEEIAFLKSTFPWCEAMPESMLKKFSMVQLCSTQNKINASASDNSRKGVDQTLLSTIKLLSKPTLVLEHQDDSKGILSPVRFDRHPRGSVDSLILQARQVCPPTGLPACDDYDLEYYGLDQSITSRGWLEIHNPASLNITIKMFSQRNYSVSSVNSARISLLENGDAVGLSENLKEIESLRELKLSLHAYRMALKMAMPWNPSADSLLIFLDIHEYMVSELLVDQTKIITEFVNFVLQRNAKLWKSSQPPLSVLALEATWIHFQALRSNSTIAAISQQDRFRFHSTQLRSDNGFSASSATDGSTQKYSNFCKRYNELRCPSQKSSSCSLIIRNKSIVLRHACSRLVKGRECGADHPAVNHK